METNPLRGLFRASSRRPVEQRVAPQPTEPTENVYFEILSGMVEKLLANPFAGDGTLHPDLHLIFVDEVCELFKLAGIPDDVDKRNIPIYTLSLWMKFVDYLSLQVFPMMLSKGRSSLYL